MAEYLILPKAPLMFRDGRPFGAEAGIAETLTFPRPSTVAGALRTAWAESCDQFDYKSGKQQLLAKHVCGPLLAEIDEHGIDVLLPTPADSVCLTDKGEARIYRLKPGTIDCVTEGTDLPHSELLPVFLQGGNNGKPEKNAPAFWYLKQFTDWLVDDFIQPFATAGQGVTAPPVEIRSHVAIEPTTQTSKTGHLYQTTGIDFSERRLSQSRDDPQRGWKQTHYGLLSRFSDDIPETFRTIGGEARLGHIRKCEKLWPECPQELTNKLNATRTFRLILITPAIFDNGYLPGFVDPKTLEGKLGSLELRLKAAAVPRWQAGTSWDMLEGGKGQGMRKVQRLAPAGSVYWFEVSQGNAGELSNYWLQSVSDQRANDGYGLAVPGIWTQ